MINLVQQNELGQRQQNLQIVKNNYLKILKRFRKKEDYNKIIRIWNDQNQHKCKCINEQIQPLKQAEFYVSSMELRKKRKSLPCPFENRVKSFNLYPVLEKQQIQKNLIIKHLKQKQQNIQFKKKEKQITRKTNNCRQIEWKLPIMSRMEKIQSLNIQKLRKNKEDKQDKINIFIKKIKQIQKQKEFSKIKKKAFTRLDNLSQKKKLIVFGKPSAKLLKIQKQVFPNYNRSYRNYLSFNAQKQCFQDISKVTGWMSQQQQQQQQNQIFGIDENA